MSVRFFIDNYRFGSMIINHEEYNADLIITPTKIIHDWWRGEGHLLTLKDLESVEWKMLNHIIIGTGWSDLMKIDPQLTDYLREQMIPFLIKPTPVAVKEFNKIDDDLKLGVFHLTC